MTKLEKTVSQCKLLKSPEMIKLQIFYSSNGNSFFFLIHFSGEFVRVDLERMYEHQDRSVKSLGDRVDSIVESKLQTCIIHLN